LFVVEHNGTRNPVKERHVRSISSLAARNDGGPLLVVSNRLPFTYQRGPRGIERELSAGGLVSALQPVLERRGGTWVGWAGSELDLPLDQAQGEAGEPYDVRFVTLSRAEVSGYYHGFANRTLWPLFHCFPTRTHFDSRQWQIYERVNARFAEVAAQARAGAELVWIHDYHLMRAPLYLRALARNARIAFFAHIPFPPYDLFRLLPWDRDLLRGLLACDLIGFHVPGYVRNFLDSAERLLGARVDHEASLVEHGDRVVRVGAFPLGIDFLRYEAHARDAPAPAPRRERVVLGVDRLDYTKGIPERLTAFECLLERHTEHRGKVVLLQVAVPSRSQVTEYRRLKREIDELVGRINGRFATARWSPIQYLCRSFPAERLAALYRDADVALITPLRDGMNLVAKEFVACQTVQPGVLVLSRLAGAAESMREALLVNPYNIDETAEAVHRALTMEEVERRSRMAALRRRERRGTVEVWTRDFLQAAAAEPAGLRPPTDDDFERWLGRFLAGSRLALFLDYDGTLTPLCERPEQAVLSEAMRGALAACAARPDTDVTIVSGRAIADVERMVGQPDITYVGNHGMEISSPGLPLFRHEDLPFYQSKIGPLARTLSEQAPAGAWVERKGVTLTFHYRAVDAAEHGKTAALARTLIAAAGFRARDAHCAVEALPPIAWDKGRAVLHILRTRFGPDWPEQVRAVYVGDDQTDEDAFRVLSGLGATFRVGGSETPTVAARLLPNVDAVLALLRWLAQRPIEASSDDRRVHAGAGPQALAE
jgi:trehalose 6-phosphate synthase/phosphatase